MITPRPGSKKEVSICLTLYFLFLKHWLKAYEDALTFYLYFLSLGGIASSRENPKVELLNVTEPPPKQKTGFMSETGLVAGSFFAGGGCTDGNNWYVYCNNNPLSFTDPTGLLTREGYNQMVKASEAIWKPKQDWWGDKGIGSEGKLTVWFYGFYGGANHNAGVSDDFILKNLYLFNRVEPLNSVDAAFRKHDWNGIDPKTMKFVDLKSEQALISNYALAQDLKEIIKSGVITDKDGVKLVGNELIYALQAANQAYGEFTNGQTMLKAETAMRENMKMSEKEFETWKNLPETQKKIQDARNVKIGELKE